MLAPRGFVTRSPTECPILDTCPAPHATRSLGPEAHSVQEKRSTESSVDSGTVGARRAQRNTEPRARSQGRLPGGGDASAEMRRMRRHEAE